MVTSSDTYFTFHLTVLLQANLKQKLFESPGSSNLFWEMGMEFCFLAFSRQAYKNKQKNKKVYGQEQEHCKF